MQSSFSLDNVQFINNFLKLFPLNLNAVAVVNEPICMFVFLCQFPQFVFPNAEVAWRFFYSQRVTLPYWNIRIVDEDRESLSSVPTIEGFEDLKGID